MLGRNRPAQQPRPLLPRPPPQIIATQIAPVPASVPAHPPPHPPTLARYPIQSSLSLDRPPIESEPLGSPQRDNSHEQSENSEDVEHSEDEEASDEDDEARYQNLRANVMKFNDGILLPATNKNLFDGVSGLLDLDSPSDRGDKGTRNRGKGSGLLRGPRKAAEPTGDIKLRLSQATEAFLAEDYVGAHAIISEVIRINAETQEAWNIMSSIQVELGGIYHSANALAVSATLRPKEVSGWLNAANYALRQTQGERAGFLEIAYYCFSSAIRADTTNVEARFGKADIKLERGQLAGAVSDYQRIMKHSPYNLRAVRRLGATYFDARNIKKAQELYRKTFDYQKTSSDPYREIADWNDVSTYIALFEYQQEYQAAIRELKSIARWLLGRESETYFDAITDNDCEWDVDDARRAQLPEFILGRFDVQKYGKGLPIELRVKLGTCRLRLGQREEAIRHLDCLDHLNDSNWIIEKYQIYLEAADSLVAAGLFQNALPIYRSIKEVPELATAHVFIKMAKCFQNLGVRFKAEECLQTAIQVDEDNIDARMELAKMYEDLGQKEQAFILVNEAIQKERDIHAIPSMLYEKRKRGRPQVVKRSLDTTHSIVATKHRRARAYKPRTLADPAERAKEETARARQLDNQYSALIQEREAMRNGDSISTKKWIEAARDLTNDFRACNAFYDGVVILKFLGYTGVGSQTQDSIDPELTAIADRLSKNLGGETSDELRAKAVGISNGYRGITIRDWFDIFLEYALCLARNEKGQEAYEICEAVANAKVFCNSSEDQFQLHVTWCTCAILVGDEKACVAVARYFMKEHQFASDSYRIFTAMVRMSNSPTLYFPNDTSRKFIQRQVKLMDDALLDTRRRDEDFAQHISNVNEGVNDHLAIDGEMDIALLMLYGHVLFANQSHLLAINYYFRAYALDPENPTINLSIGLCYAHHALKRGAENRQHLILQSLTFFSVYYDSRKLSCKAEERREAHYNMARVYHMLGLTHLALPYYSLVLEEVEHDGGEEQAREILATEAAYNLQTIYSLAGNPELASAITEKWLLV